MKHARWCTQVTAPWKTKLTELCPASTFFWKLIWAEQINKIKINLEIVSPFKDNLLNLPLQYIKVTYKKIK